MEPKACTELWLKVGRSETFIKPVSWSRVDHNTALILGKLQTHPYVPAKLLSRRRSESQRGRNPGTPSLTSSAPNKSHCFSKENWGPVETHSSHSCRMRLTFSPSIRERHSATLDMSRAIRMKNWTALCVPSRHSGFVPPHLSSLEETEIHASETK